MQCRWSAILYGAIHSGVLYGAAKIGISAHRCGRVGGQQVCLAGCIPCTSRGATLNIDTLHCLRPTRSYPQQHYHRSTRCTQPSSEVTKFNLHFQYYVLLCADTCTFVKLPLVQQAKSFRFSLSHLSLKGKYTSNTVCDINIISTWWPKLLLCL